MSKNTFEAEFQRRIEDIKRRAAAAGTSITALCQATKIARATPDRWQQKAPKTIRLVDELEAELAKLELTPAAQATQAGNHVSVQEAMSKHRPANK